MTSPEPPFLNAPFSADAREPDGGLFTLDPVTRTARGRLGRRTLGDDAVQYESLRTRHIAGVETTGQRLTVNFPTGYFGDNGPVTLVDEQWESRELGLLIYARYTDSRSGAIEYRLTNVRRTDPSPDLFVVPSDYTLVTPAGTADDPLLHLGTVRAIQHRPRGGKTRAVEFLRFPIRF